MKKTTKVKKITNALKRFVTPTAQIDDEPELAETVLKLVERLEALEKKTDLMMGQMSNLSIEIRNVIQTFQRSNSVQPVPVPHPRPSSTYPTQKEAQRPYGAQSKPLPQSSPVSQPSEVLGSPAQGPGRGRRDRLLHKAICADCSKDCEVPIKPTEGRPVYCKACFILRKSAKTLPVKNSDRIDAVGTMQKMTARVPSSLPVTPQAAPIASTTPVADASMMRSSGYVPAQTHNLARRSAVAYMAKKAGHLTGSQGGQTQPPASGGPPAMSPASRSVSRSRPSVRNDRTKPKKRSR